MTKRIFVIIALTVLVASCASREKMAYFQNIASLNLSEKGTNYNPKLQPDDLLTIIVSAQVAEAALPFNLSTISVNSGANEVASGQIKYQPYLIDSKGFIEFPVLGSIKIGGLSREDALKKITTMLKKYITDPIVNLRILNFKISVMGEVTKPGTYTIQSERITLPEALSLAGDMTIYGKRNNVLLIREIDGKRTSNYLDLTKADFLNSEFYYLSQNDLIVIETNKTKMNSSAVGPNTTVIVSALSLLITVIALLKK